MPRLYKIIFLLAGISVATLGFSDQIQPLLDVGLPDKLQKKHLKQKLMKWMNKLQ